MNTKIKTATLGLMTACAIAGCGSQAITKTVTAKPTQSPNTGMIERKFAVCIAEAAYLGGTQPDCDPTSLQASPYSPASVTCVYKSGNEYTCQATADPSESKYASQINGMWDVTYDGSGLAWQAQ